MAEKYDISTIKDVFEKVPTERVEPCMRELTALILEVKAHQGSAAQAAKRLDPRASAQVKFPEVVTWVDDGAGMVDVTFREPVLEEEFRLQKAVTTSNEGV